MRQLRVIMVLVVLLAGSFLASGPATAYSGEQPFTLVGMAREGENVTYEVRSNTPLNHVAVSLRDAGSVVGLPEYRVNWRLNEVKAFNFTLVEEKSHANLVFRWEYSLTPQSQTIGVPVPRGEGGADPEPRLVVLSALRDGSALNVTVANVGGAHAESVLVALEDAAGRKIAQPYYVHLPRVPARASEMASFSVSGALDTVTVLVDHADAAERTTVSVHKARAGGGGGGGGSTRPANVTLETELPFREVDVGRTVDYALRVTNTGRLALVNLDVDGLPSGYSARFFVGGSAVPSLYLAENATRQVTLSITIPNAESEVDRTVDFRVNARVNDTVRESLPLGLAVRGVGKLEVSGSLDLAGIPPGGSERLTVTVTNTGTAPLFDVELQSQRPYGWTFRFDPRRLDRLDPGDSQTITVEVNAPDVIGEGRYAADLTARSGDVTSRPATMSMDVVTPGGGGAWAWGVFLVLIGGILGGAAWWKRRGPHP